MQKCFAIVMAVMFGVAAANAADRYVWSGGDESSNFDSWAHAAKTISNALNNAGSSDTIIVTSGVYQIDAELAVGNSITVQGVGDGEVVVDGQCLTRCFRLTGSAVLTNLTIIRGYASYAGWGASAGAGVRLEGGSVLNCKIRECAGPLGGGASFHSGGIMRDCTISACTNNGNGWGGAVYMNLGGLIDRTLFCSNSGYWGGAIGFDAGGQVLNSTSIYNTATWGGGMFNYNAGFVSNCTIAFNQSTAFGGGVFSDQGNCTVRDSAIVSNYSGNVGGGVYSAANGIGATAALFTGCTIAGNHAANVGGGLYLGYKALITNCKITGNWADNAGGAVYGQGGIMRDCLLDGNEARNYGGGITFDLPSTGPVVENCTITRNRVVGGSPAMGGGVSTYPTGAGNYGALTNCIIYYNQDTAGSNDVNGAGIDFGYSCSPQLAQGSGGNITGMPLFVSAGSGYGTNNYVAGNYSLAFASPCRASGLVVSSWMTNAVDLAGNPRMVDGTVSMGAYEYVLPPKGALMLFR